METSEPRDDEPFHAGELAVHERLGIRQRMRDIGQRVIRTFMLEQHQQFFAQLPMMLVGSVDAAGRPWASVLVGRPGFMQAPDAGQLDVRASPIPGDPLAEGLQPGAPLGFLGIELDTRRRNRMNGHVLAKDAQGFRVRVEQTVGNCPQYIQGRDVRWARNATDLRPRAVESLDRLDEEACRFIAQADTLFVATHAPATEGEAARGADVSHRGGRAGFVRVESERSFLVPDFTGNFFFMTLGNLLVDARAGVLFIDFTSGDLLLLTGTAEVVWGDERPQADDLRRPPPEGDEQSGRATSAHDELKAFDGAERAWRFHVDSGWRLRDALPLRFDFRDWSPNSLITGTWDEATARLQAQRLAQTWRPYRVTRIVDESSVIRSFHLQPDDGHALPAFKAGQHLPIRLRPDGVAPLQRTYTISHAPGDDGLRLSVKREGAASSFLHDQVRLGHRIDALGPRGQFTIDAKARRPAVLIGAGVGITPMVAFARHLVAEGFRHRRTRPLHLIQVARDASVRAFAGELQTLVERAQGAMRLHVVLSTGAAPALTGPLSIDMLKELLPFDDHEFFSAARLASCRLSTTACATWACAMRVSRPKPSARRR
jgi:ferredoxin-NADP reductase/predicted pyridoxine 5'-phosphate oxidase superfamily flavin-nucleotide-binding protein